MMSYLPGAAALVHNDQQVDRLAWLFAECKIASYYLLADNAIRHKLGSNGWRPLCNLYPAAPLSSRRCRSFDWKEPHAASLQLLALEFRFLLSTASSLRIKQQCNHQSVSYLHIYICGCHILLIFFFTVPLRYSSTILGLPFRKPELSLLQPARANFNHQFAQIWPIVVKMAVVEVALMEIIVVDEQTGAEEIEVASPLEVSMVVMLREAVVVTSLPAAIAVVLVREEAEEDVVHLLKWKSSRELPRKIQK
jgi:hypothetical protein